MGHSDEVILVWEAEYDFTYCQKVVLIPNKKYVEF